MDLGELRVLAAIVQDFATDGDHEAAHRAEARLLTATLEAIEAGTVDPRSAALVGLSTRDLKFHRWFA